MTQDEYIRKLEEEVIAARNLLGGSPPARGARPPVGNPYGAPAGYDPYPGVMNDPYANMRTSNRAAPTVTAMPSGGGLATGRMPDPYASNNPVMNASTVAIRKPKPRANNSTTRVNRSRPKESTQSTGVNLSTIKHKLHPVFKDLVLFEVKDTIKKFNIKLSYEEITNPAFNIESTFEYKAALNIVKALGEDIRNWSLNIKFPPTNADLYLLVDKNSKTIEITI